MAEAAKERREWKMPHEQAIDLIRQHGIMGLCAPDGCVCGSFSVHHVNVDISCYKSQRWLGFLGILARIYSNSLDINAPELEPVARAVVADLRAHNKSTPIRVRFCSDEDDRDLKCVYCGGTREQTEYLCAKCGDGSDPWGDAIAPRFAFPEIVDFPATED